MTEKATAQIQRRTKRFIDLPRPFICTIVADEDPAQCVRTIRQSLYDGADAFELNLMHLRREHHTAADLKAIYTSTDRPVLVCHYRWDYERSIDLDEEARIQALTDAFEAGACGIDLEADAFAPVPGPAAWTAEARAYTLSRTAPPREFTTDPEAVRRQRALIDAIHARGGEVLMSAHTRVHLSPSQAVDMAKAMEDRGADIAKVVSADMSAEDLMDTLRATVAMQKALAIPFIMISHGEDSKIARLVCPMLGSMLAFATQPISPSYFPLQPPVRSIKAVFDNTDWSVTKPPEEQRWL